MALQVRDALLGALTTSFNNYLDLGASVMLLWCFAWLNLSPVLCRTDALVSRMSLQVRRRHRDRP